LVSHSESPSSVPCRFGPAQPGLKLRRSSVAEVVEQWQCLPPVVACGVRTPGGLVSVSEMSKDVGFVESVTLAAEQSQCLLVAGQCLVVPAQVMVGPSHAVPGSGLALYVAVLLVQRHGLADDDQALFVVAELAVAPAQVVQGNGLPAVVSEFGVDREGLLALNQLFAVAALSVEERAQPDVDVRLSGTIAAPAVEVERLLVVVLGVAGAA